MKNPRLDGLYFLVLGSALFVLLSAVVTSVSPWTMEDFRTQYYPARCLLQHGDPYNESDVARVYFAEHGNPPGGEQISRFLTTRYIYLPTAFPFTIPFAVFPLKAARLLWMIASFAAVLVGAFLTWDLGAEYAPILSGIAAGALVANSQLIVTSGNAAGIVIGFCLVAVWAFLRNRWVWAGIVCLAFALAIKPQISGLIWLFFLLAGSSHRKRALQTLAATAILSLPSVLWVSYVAPNWLAEIHTNMTVLSELGGITPQAATATTRPTMMVNLQIIGGFFHVDPLICAVIVYLVCGAMLALWIRATYVQPPSRRRDLLGLAAISLLSMLPVYHRECDAKLLLLAIPASALLWAEGGRLGRWASVVMSMILVVIADIPWVTGISLVERADHWSLGPWRGLLHALLILPAPLGLLLAAVFYLFAYVWQSRKPSLAAEQAEAARVVTFGE